MTEPLEPWKETLTDEERTARRVARVLTSDDPFVGLIDPAFDELARLPSSDVRAYREHVRMRSGRSGAYRPR